MMALTQELADGYDFDRDGTASALGLNTTGWNNHQWSQLLKVSEEKTPRMYHVTQTCDDLVAGHLGGREYLRAEEAGRAGHKHLLLGLRRRQLRCP